MRFTISLAIVITLSQAVSLKSHQTSIDKPFYRDGSDADRKKTLQAHFYADRMFELLGIDIVALNGVVSHEAIRQGVQRALLAADMESETYTFLLDLE